jgi:hypothetical protein
MRDCANNIQQQEADDEELKEGDEERKNMEQKPLAKPEDFVCGLCQQDDV